MLHKSLGNAMVQRVVEALNHQPGEIPSGPARVHGAAHGLRVRSTPSQEQDNVLAMLADHEQTTVKAQAGAWLAIDHPKGQAFVHSHFIEPVSSDGTTGNDHPHVPPPGHAAQETQPAPAIVAPPTVSATPAPTPTPLPIVAPPAPIATAAPAQGGGGEQAHAPAPPAPVVAHHVEAPQATPAGNTVDIAPQASNTFTTEMGNQVVMSTTEEVAVLNQIRANPNRLDPDWLRATQVKYSVGDATGAMNTETVRMLRVKLGALAFTADNIMNETFLHGLNNVGTPFFGTTELGITNDEKKKPKAGANSPKDKTAQALGFASFKDYASSWGDVTLLDKTLPGKAHPYLINRVAAADKYLRGRHPDAKTQAALFAAVKWNGNGNASYDDDSTSNATHQHAMGLAIDIDPGQNAYLFDHHVQGKTADESQWFVDIFTQTFAVSTKLYGTDAVDQKTLFDWTNQYSTEELMPRVESASEGFKKLLDMSKRGSQKEIHDALAPHYKGEALKKAVDLITNINRWFHMQEGRRNAVGVTNLHQELVIALRDVAGLAWGGVEISPNENADFMHFDCRQTDFGGQIYKAGVANYTP